MKVIIAEELPSMNKGEVAILMGLLESLKQIGPCEVALLTGRKDIDEPRYSKIVNLMARSHSSTSGSPGKGYIVKSFISYLLLTILGRNGLKFVDKAELSWWSYLLDSDIVIIGHDNTMANGLVFDSYGLILFSKLRRKMLVYYAGSFGPFRSRSKAWAARIALDMGDLITLREATSYEYLRSIGIRNQNMHVTADLAFLMNPASNQDIEKTLEKEDIQINGPWIGINASSTLSRLALSEIETYEEKFRQFCKIMARTADSIVEKFNARILLIPHVFGIAKNNDDRLILQKIYELANRKDAMTVLHGEYSPQILKTIIGKMEMFIGCRTHSMIAATSMGVPTIAMTSRGHEFMKTNGIIGGMMQLDEMLIYVEDLNIDTLLFKIENAWKNRADIRKKLTKRQHFLFKAASKNGSLFKQRWSKHL